MVRTAFSAEPGRGRYDRAPFRNFVNQLQPVTDLLLSKTRIAKRETRAHASRRASANPGPAFGAEPDPALASDFSARGAHTEVVKRPTGAGGEPSTGLRALRWPIRAP
eukprot:6013957-Pyramimonas_sp.AAC.1